MNTRRQFDSFPFFSSEFTDRETAPDFTSSMDTVLQEIVVAPCHALMLSVLIGMTVNKAAYACLQEPHVFLQSLLN